MCELLQKYIPQNACVLDAGCGDCYYTGKIEKALADKNASIAGIDISKFALIAAAKRSKLTFGNINLDYSVNVNDASLLQQYLSGNAEFDSLQMYHADINRDGKINVQDVTALQNALSE
jgi:2-polyprenyl-3-methyl-5-hydroxy-6-metoxy-1,4-benzoquinol methylase